MLKISRQT